MRTLSFKASRCCSGVRVAAATCFRSVFSSTGAVLALFAVSASLASLALSALLFLGVLGVFLVVMIVLVWVEALALRASLVRRLVWVIRFSPWMRLVFGTWMSSSKRL